MRPPADTPPSFLPLATRAVLEIGGPDRRPFLQGLITNDIARVGATAAIHAALLTPQGRILHDFMIVELGDTLLIDAEAAGAEDLARRLGAYRLRSKVTVARLADWGVAALPGLQGPATLGLPPQAGAARIRAQVLPRRRAALAEVSALAAPAELRPLRTLAMRAYEVSIKAGEATAGHLATGGMPTNDPNSPLHVEATRVKEALLAGLAARGRALRVDVPPARALWP